MNNPLVCIIIVNYNGEEDTIACIKSLNRMTYSIFDIIVVDNCSTNPISETGKSIIENIGHLIFLNQNLGFAGGNNVGIKYAIDLGAELVCLLNNDTEVEPDFLDIMVDQYLKNPDVGIIGGRINYYYNKDLIWYGGGHFDEKSGWGMHERNKEICKEKTGVVRKVTFITGCLMLIPAKTLKKVGLLDESMFLYCEDTDYCCKVNKAGLKMLYCEDVKIYHKVNGATSKINDIKYYYLIRNIFFMIKHHCPKKAAPYFYHAIYIVKNVVRGRVRLRVALQALCDFLKNKMGHYSR